MAILTVISRRKFQCLEESGVARLLALYHRRRSPEQQEEELSEGFQKCAQLFIVTRAPSLLLVAASWAPINKQHIGEHF